MIWKPRWFLKSISWRLISLSIAGLIVHLLRDAESPGIAYVLIWGPLGTVLFIAHEKVYHVLKLKARDKRQETKEPWDSSVHQSSRRETHGSRTTSTMSPRSTESPASPRQ